MLNRWTQWSALDCSSAKIDQTQRPPGGGLSVSRSAGDQATLSTVLFCFRRYVMKPTPQKPRIIMAQVEGSGTPETTGALVAPTGGSLMS